MTAGDAALGRQVAEVAPRVHDLATFLTGVLGVTDVGAHFPHRVTYHPTCPFTIERSSAYFH